MGTAIGYFKTGGKIFVASLVPMVILVVILVLLASWPVIRMVMSIAFLPLYIFLLGLFVNTFWNYK